MGRPSSGGTARLEGWRQGVGCSGTRDSVLLTSLTSWCPRVWTEHPAPQVCRSSWTVGQWATGSAPPGLRRVSPFSARLSLPSRGGWSHRYSGDTCEVTPAPPLCLGETPMCPPGAAPSSVPGAVCGSCSEGRVHAPLAAGGLTGLLVSTEGWSHGGEDTCGPQPASPGGRTLVPVGGRDEPPSGGVTCRQEGEPGEGRADVAGRPGPCAHSDAIGGGTGALGQAGQTRGGAGLA